MADPVASSASSPVMRRRASYRALGSLSPRPRVVSFSRGQSFEEEPRHFLDACFLCRRPLGSSRDVFMYRGDTPFCSDDCRQEQIKLDEARENEDANYWRSSRRSHRVRESGSAVAGGDVDPEHPRPGRGGPRVRLSL